jgi:hypothetical protein
MGGGVDAGRSPSAASASSAAAYIPLAMVATITREMGANEIASENGRLRAYVQANVQDRDLGGFVSDAKDRIASQLVLPAGYSLSWSGQYEYLQRAIERLKLVVPLTLSIIVLGSTIYLIWNYPQPVLFGLAVLYVGGGIVVRFAGVLRRRFRPAAPSFRKAPTGRRRRGRGHRTVRAGRTPRRAITRCVQAIKGAGAPVAGVVLNRLQRRRSLGYGYYYDSYYDYSYHGKYSKKGVYGSK